MSGSITLKTISDLYSGAKARANAFVCQFDCWNKEIQDFCMDWFLNYRPYSLFIDKPIQNPTEQQLLYFRQQVDSSYDLTYSGIQRDLKRWMPKISPLQLEKISLAMVDVFDQFREEGKNENIIRNAYIKFMCWLFYRFNQILMNVGHEVFPKIFYFGLPQKYECTMLQILAKVGVDIMVFTTEKMDHNSFPAFHNLSPMPFPKDLSAKWIAKEAAKQKSGQITDKNMPSNLTNTLPGCKWQVYTNKNSSNAPFDDILRKKRLQDKRCNNYFYCIRGTEDKDGFSNKLYQFKMSLIQQGREPLIFNQSIEYPRNDEISAIKRCNGLNRDQTILELSRQIPYPGDAELHTLFQRKFYDLLSAERDNNPNRTITKAVYLLVWIRRYLKHLLNAYANNDIPVVIHFGACTDEKAFLFLRLLSMLPVDVLLICPQLNDPVWNTDVIKNYEGTQSSDLSVYPTDKVIAPVTTTAYRAERELDTILYQDSGIYRNHQFTYAKTVGLKVMYEELGLLWNQDLTLRPGFSVEEGVVTIPAIFAKVNGVDKNLSDYWKYIKSFITANTLVITNNAYCTPVTGEQQSRAVRFLDRGNLRRDAIQKSSTFQSQYGFLKEDVQERILDGLQQLLQEKLIRGTFENGMEYIVTSVILNLKKEIIRMIQSFDYTKKSPKVICVQTTEAIMSIEDNILLAFLHLLGFDILCFVPTGYQVIGGVYTQNIVEEYQIEEYLYDLNIPTLSVSTSQSQSIFSRLRGLF